MGDELAKVIYFSVFCKTIIKNTVTIREETHCLLGFFFIIINRFQWGCKHAEKNIIDNINCNRRDVCSGNGLWRSESRCADNYEY